MIGAHLSAAVTNLRIMETDVDRGPWDGELFTTGAGDPRRAPAPARHPPAGAPSRTRQRSPATPPRDH